MIRHFIYGYQEVYLLNGEAGEDNIEQLIRGYCDYFIEVGESMSALGLRSFRKIVSKTIHIARSYPQFSVEEESINSDQDTAILDFCSEHFVTLEQNGLSIGMTTELVSYLIDQGTPIRDVENLKEVKTKVKALCTPSQGK